MEIKINGDSSAVKGILARRGCLISEALGGATTPALEKLTSRRSLAKTTQAILRRTTTQKRMQKNLESSNMKNQRRRPGGVGRGSA